MARWHFEISPMLFSSPVVCEVAFYEPQRLGGLGLWTLAGSWAAGSEVSRRAGFIPSNLPDHLTPSRSDLSVLIEHGFWNFAQDDDGQLGYQMAQGPVLDRQRGSGSNGGAANSRKGTRTVEEWLEVGI